MNKVIIICGPTSSGKTLLGHLVAQNNLGEIINADSMQVYKDLPIITASPSIEFKQQLPYHLYNFLDITDEYSVAKYIHQAAEKVKYVISQGKLPIVVGGSGMYISALISGLSNMPDIDCAIREKVRNLQSSLSNADFFNLLAQVDPKISSILHPQDKQRVARSYEIYLQTGRSILEHQQCRVKLLTNCSFKIIMLLPERNFLYLQCNNRLAKMFSEGAIDEIQALDSNTQELLNMRNLTKILGVNEIIRYLLGEISLTSATSLAQAKTRQYAKRQITWFNNQIPDKTVLSFSNAKEYGNQMQKIVKDLGRY